MKRFLSILLITCAVLFPALLAAQCSEAEARFDRDQIRIGEQVELQLRVHYCEGSSKTKVEWPQFTDTLVKGIDIIGSDSIKTQLVNRAAVLYEQSRTLTVTSIDTGFYTIPSIRFRIGSEEVLTKPVTLYVGTVPVDTTKPIKDIKDIYNVPPASPEAKAGFHFPWWLWLTAAVLLAAIVALIIFLVRKKPAPPEQPERVLLPHERVLGQLAEIGRRKPWLSGDQKSYYTPLTEIMRGWLVERYRIHALEMTTGEIIRQLYRGDIPDGSVADLERVLRTADLVKFAKAFPDNEENERNLQLAINFVQATAVIPAPPQPSLTQP